MQKCCDLRNASTFKIDNSTIFPQEPEKMPPILYFRHVTDFEIRLYLNERRLFSFGAS
jgi:hypothetical protein